MVAQRPGTRARLLVLGAGPAQLGFLEAAHARDDVHVIAVDRDGDAVGFALADERAVLSSEDEPGIDRLARAREVDGIVSPGADWPVGIAARVTERLGIAHPIDVRTAIVATSKARQRERFVASGVPHAALLDPEDPAIRLPCVVKAPDRQGQRGLSLVATRAELDEALQRAASESRSGNALVEELVDGPEVTVNAVSLDGEFVPLLVTDRLTAEPPGFGVALAHVAPASVDDEAAVIAAARAAVEAIGIRHGPSYTQLRVGPDGPVVMEVAARLGGGHDAELVEAVTGVALNALAVSFALGEPVQLPSFPQSVSDTGYPQAIASPHAVSRPACEEIVADLCTPTGGESVTKPSRSERANRGGTDGTTSAPASAGAIAFLVPPPGRLLETTGVAGAEALDGVRWVRLYRAPGHVFGPLRRGVDRAGAVLAIGGTRGEAVDRARRATQTVRFRVDADAP